MSTENADEVVDNAIDVAGNRAVWTAVDRAVGMDVYVAASDSIWGFVEKGIGGDIWYELGVTMAIDSSASAKNWE